ncbi:MAG: CAAD domain-containing protein [Synechococcaceae cyanobacterium]|nr:CAAD domain-containing protein [Synechococcaceae cyanobacterium]
MSEASTETTAPAAEAPASETGGATIADFKERYGEVIGKLNDSLDQVDWSQIGKFAKATGIILAVIVAQILIKGVLDTINLLPVVPGLLELLGLVVVGNWSWQNLSTRDKRDAVFSRLQSLRQDYLG